MGTKIEIEKNLPLKSNDLEELFNKHIAAYGWKNEIKEKVVQEEGVEDDAGDEETYRTSLRRQRDKILYTGGFRRLQDKTQVISATSSGDHRTRLTHTLEVEQIAVSIANALKLNVDLVSAIALGHDVGHTPFGHAAERKLSKLLEKEGQFHHPIQSIRYLWEKYGSKIDPEIYEGILLHDSDMFKIDKKKVQNQFNYLKKSDNESVEFEEWVKVDEWINSFPSTLEAQVVIWADKIAYITHDLEDFLGCSAYANLENSDATIEKQLCSILNDLIFKKNIDSLKDFESRDLIRSIIRNLIISSVETINKINNLQQVNVKRETENRQSSSNSNSKNKVYLDSLIINFSKEYRDKYYDLRKFLDDYYILSPEVQKNDAKAEVIVEWLFNKLRDKHKLLPLKIRNEIDNAIIEAAYEDKYLSKIVNDIYKEKTKEQRRISQLISKINDIKEESIKAKTKKSQTKQQQISEEKSYDNLEKKVVSRKVACYIATMSDTYAENMYRDLIGSSVDFNL